MFRPMRRFKQQLSGEECAEILQSEPRGVLAVLGDGPPGHDPGAEGGASDRQAGARETGHPVN